MSPETITAIAAILMAAGSLIGVFVQRGGTIAKIQLDMIEPMSKRITKLESDVKKERRISRVLRKKILRLIEGIKILTRQLCDNGIQPEFELEEDFEVDLEGEEDDPDDKQPE